ncbi:MAG: hypothetical protein VYC39_18295 [Myxococcota bacterium]|nr:hypothetical protein [Myxococcota bacterium]
MTAKAGIFAALTLAQPALAMQPCPEGTGQSAYLIWLPAIVFMLGWSVWFRRYIRTKSEAMTKAFLTLVSLLVASVASLAVTALALAFIPCS